ncbi:unnamed protein product [Effrenium voratum]|uniref:Uncharacterized protein n=1 Tax=Effrenium voratum TaxID=2562239 RepID=A0AA36I7Y5_9DINO|nr:unnamed protein product [Effrenium voratum]CAJ1447336.1 unnamed protein product [Effrenium voratum]
MSAIHSFIRSMLPYVFALLLLRCPAEQPRSRSQSLEVDADGDVSRPLMRSQAQIDVRTHEKPFLRDLTAPASTASGKCLAGIQSQTVCCPKSCQTCGGPVCSLLNGGRDACCFVNIMDSQRVCGPGVGAPCVVAEHEEPRDACDGITSVPVCCPESCGACGGSACSQFPGGSENCCHRTIVGAGRKCSEETAPPCAMYDDRILNPPATVVATTATMTSTSTTTTTLTTTSVTVTTSTKTVTTITETTTTVTGTTTITTTKTVTATTSTITTTVLSRQTVTTTTLVTNSWTTQAPTTETTTPGNVSP